MLCRPFEFGADIVVHSTTKYMDGHALQVGGVIVDCGNFDWASGKFPEFTEPDPSYHGLVYSQAFGKADYIVKARVQLMRDMGCCQSPQGAFYINQGLETLPLRMERHCRNAEAIAAYLEKHPAVESVNYPRRSATRKKPWPTSICPTDAAASFPSPSRAEGKQALALSTALK